MHEILSFIMYSFVLTFPFLLFIACRKFWLRSRRLFYFTAFLPTALFSSLRGNSGTDTESYREAYAFLDINIFPPFSVDYLFTILLYVCKVFDFGFQGFAFIQAFLCLIFYSIGAAKIDKMAPVLGLGILPVVFLDSTFNGIRYGLAFAVAAVCLPAFQKRGGLIGFVYLCLPAFIHSSLSFLLLLAPLFVATAVVGVAALGFDITNYYEFFLNKADAYSDYIRPNSFSGLIPLITFSLLLVLNLVNKYRFRIGLNLGFVSIVIFFAGVLLATQSYAGLRIMQIGVFMLAVNTSQFIDQLHRNISTRLSILIGAIATVNFFRQIFFVGAEGGVAFHPYSFFWTY